MGITLIVQDVDFSDANLGKVTLTGTTPITGIDITGPDVVAGATNAATFLPSFVPANTTQRGVQWSIVSGSSYATINASSGALSVLQGASASAVTIRVTSTANNTIYAEKTISVTYSSTGYLPLEVLTASINFSGTTGKFITDIALQSGDWIKAKVCMIQDRQIVFVGSRKTSSADTDSIMVERDASGLSYKALVVKMFGTKFTSSQVMALNTRYVIEARSSGVQSTPSVGTFSQTTYTYTQSYPLAIACLGLEGGTATYNTGGCDIFGIEIYNSSDELQHRLIPQQNLTFLDEVTGTVYQPDSTAGLTYADDQI